MTEAAQRNSRESWGVVDWPRLPELDVVKKQEVYAQNATIQKKQSDFKVSRDAADNQPKGLNYLNKENRN